MVGGSTSSLVRLRIHERAIKHVVDKFGDADAGARSYTIHYEPPVEDSEWIIASVSVQVGAALLGWMASWGGDVLFDEAGAGRRFAPYNEWILAGARLLDEARTSTDGHSHT